MKGMFNALSVLLLLVMFGATSAAQGASPPVKVFVSILPQAYFVERIGGDAVDVDVLVGPGHEPATYEPTPKQMARMGHAQVYFRIGTPFEEGFIGKLGKIFKGLLIVDTRKGVPLRYFESSSGKEIPDPHIWLDPKRGKIQAETIYRTLREIDPVHEEMYKRNLRAFNEDLDAVDGKIAHALDPLRGRSIYVFHPAFGYFCDSYGLKQIAVEVEGKEPSPKQLSRLIDRAKKEGVKVIFVQPEFSGKNARVIARAIGGAVVPMDPLARDYLNNLDTMADHIKEALSGS
ncbi:MAG: zinc ABC transporter substrate-binding protein [Deltaproteobacteria bacterium]|nr:zinc ABC transporter substrate-binding protein [Deltaproteobacteria bacterium]